MTADRLRRAFRLALILSLAALPLAAQGPDPGRPDPGRPDPGRPDPSPPAGFAERWAAWERHRELDRESLFRGLSWRSVGPVVQGGRVVDVEPVPGEPYTFYVAYASGGLWRTTNNGVTFEPLMDDQPAMILGDVAVDPNNPRTLWAGSGENNSSRSSYGGLGVFRSDDAGETWRYVGLGESDRIGRVVVDPRDSARVFVAALGKLYTPGGERGVYRTSDGGETWHEVLAGDPERFIGFVDLALDPSNSDTLYAASWQRSRRPWDFVEGGPGSGLWKSTDGGDTWRRLAGGFPSGEHVGRIGLAVSASRPQTVYACVDNQEILPEELWDLGDGAVTAKRLRRMTREELLAQDPEEIEDFIRANDLDAGLDAAKLRALVESGEVTLEDLVAELDDANASLFTTDVRGLEVWRSDDGGTTWRRTHDEPIREAVYTYGYYFGQIRVAPDDAEKIYVVGVPLLSSADGGRTFAAVDGRDVHADHHELWIDPSFPGRMISGNDGGLDVSYDGGVSWLKLDAQPVGQFYTVAVDMAEPYNIYGGLQDNGVLKGSSTSRPGLDRWQPIGGGDGMHVAVDPRDNQTVYWGYQFGFYTRNDPGGERRPVRPRDRLKEPALRYNWSTPILLSTHNGDILYFGANRLYRSLDRGESWTAISPDLSRSGHRGDVPFATLTTIAESPLAFGLLWAGTDDGWVHVSDDGGAEWTEVAAGLPRDRWVTRVEASHHVRERAYVSLSGYRDDDIVPYVYTTDDLGATWKPISAGLPAEAVNVVREDPVHPDVLYLGTDRGAYVSLDRGTSWQSLPAGMPNVPVHDLVVHPRERELVAGTHGRSIYVLDALPIQELTAEVRDSAVHVFPLADVRYERDWRQRRSLWHHRPEDDPFVRVPFWAAAAGAAELAVLDGAGRELRRLAIEAARGVNAFTWDLVLDPELAPAAERAALANAADAAADADDRPRRRRRARGEPASEPVAAGERAKTPWAEAVRLGRPIYVTPGSYTLRVSSSGGESETGFEVTAPEPREPRQKPAPKIRGRKLDE